MTDIYDNSPGPSSALTGPNNSFQGSGGPQFFNQIPQQRSPILLWQGTAVANTWLNLMDAPRNPYTQIQDVWISLQSGAAMDCYFAILGYTTIGFSSVAPPANQADVFQINQL